MALILLDVVYFCLFVVWLNIFWGIGSILKKSTSSALLPPLWRAALSWPLFSWLARSPFPNRYFLSSSLSGSSEPKSSCKPMVAQWWLSFQSCRENSAKKDYSKLCICVTPHCSKARGFITWQDQAKWTSVILPILIFGTRLIVINIRGEGPRIWQNASMSQVCSHNHAYCLSISLQISLMISMLFEKELGDLLKGIPSNIFPWTSHIFNIKQYSIVWNSRH